MVALTIAGCAGEESSPAPVPTDAGVSDGGSDPNALGQPDEPDGSGPSTMADSAPSPSSVGSCCATQETPGCEEPAVEACVCAIDRLCCAGAWDERCVALVDAEGCGQCGTPPSTACEVRQVSDEAPSMLRGALGASDEVATDAVELSCGSIAEPELLFAFTAPEAGSYVFSTAGSEVFDTVLAVIDGTACDGEELACNDDDTSELTSRVVLELAAGQAVLVAVESWGEEAGAIEVEVTAGDGGPAIIDEQSCTVTDLPATLPASVTGEASDEADLLTPSCALYGSSGEALYRFTADQAGRYRFDTRGSDVDTVVQVLDGDCAGEELACNDDSDLGGLAAIAELDMSAGQTVVINVDSFDGMGSYALSVDRMDAAAEEPAVESTGSCCSPQAGGGCADAAIAACVCAVDDYCCTGTWDALCVEAVSVLECGGC